MRSGWIKQLVVCALLTALGVVLSGFLNIPFTIAGVYSLKIGFGALAPILAGMLYGPLFGGMVGAVVDVLQALLFVRGGYMPWFTVVAALSGIIPGLYFATRSIRAGVYPFWRILAAVATAQIICSVLLNTLLLSWLYSANFEILVVARAINQAIMIPVYALAIFWIVRILRKAKVIE